jgi:hypothetical protein
MTHIEYNPGAKAPGFLFWTRKVFTLLRERNKNPKCHGFARTSGLYLQKRFSSGSRQ